MWNRLLIAFAIVICFSTPSVRAEQSLEANVDRPGNDIRNFDIAAPTPGTFGNEVDGCRMTCERDDNCKAWTLVRPGLQGPKARCWLKSGIPAAAPNNCCTSGVPVRAIEANIDRPGSDYRNMDLASGDPKLCQTECEKDRSKCQAWTFVRAGVQGPKPRCWLKTAVPAAAVNTCCTSGALGPVVR